MRDGASVLGLQLGGKWTVGTGFTENGVLLDGVLTKLGSELVWDYDWDEPLAPWRITDPDGQIEVVALAVVAGVGVGFVSGRGDTSYIGSTTRSTTVGRSPVTIAVSTVSVAAPPA